MLPSLASFPTGSGRGRIVDEDDLTRRVNRLNVDELLDSFRARGSDGGNDEGNDDGDDDGERMRRSWRSLVDRLSEAKGGGGGKGEELHAELLILTQETDEARASALLDLGEKALLRVLGGVAVARVDVNVVTSQPKTEAKLNLFERGVRLASTACGLGGLSLHEAEDFLATRAANEFEMMMLRFYDADTTSLWTDGGGAGLTMRLVGSGRTLELQRGRQNGR